MLLVVNGMDSLLTGNPDIIKDLTVLNELKSSAHRPVRTNVGLCLMREKVN